MAPEAIRTKWDELTEPFKPEDHEWLTKSKSRDKRKVMLVPYIRKPAIIERLVSVFGVDGFSLTIDTPVVQSVVNSDGVESYIAYTKATLSLSKEGVVFSDIGASTIGYDPETAIKGSATDAVKRVAKLIGIGLYLDRGGDLTTWVPANEYGYPEWYPLLVVYGNRPYAVNPDPEFPTGNNKGKRLSQVDRKTLEAAYDWFEKNEDAKQKQLAFFLALAHKLGRL